MKRTTGVRHIIGWVRDQAGTTGATLTAGITAIAIIETIAVATVLAVPQVGVRVVPRRGRAWRQLPRSSRSLPPHRKHHKIHYAVGRMVRNAQSGTSVRSDRDRLGKHSERKICNRRVRGHSSDRP